MTVCRKFIGLMLCAAILLSCIGTVSAKETFVPDIQGKSLVKALGFFDNFTEEYVTRREYAEALLRASGRIEADVNIADSVLSDMAREAKLFGVYDDGKPGLDNHISYGEIMSGIIYTLGYDITMQNDQKSLSDMIVKAKQLGIGKGVNKTENEYITGNEFGEFVYHMLMTDAVEINGYTSTGVNADIRKNRTLLEIYHNIYKYTGKVTANCRSAIYDSNGVGDNKIRLGNELVMDTGNTDAEFYLGYVVDCYYRNTNNESELIWIDKNSKCKELYLEAHDITGYSNREYSYTEGNKIKKARLDPGISVIYNSIAVRISQLTTQQLKPDVGEVSLIDCDNSGSYDTLIIMDYESAINGGVSDKGIVDKDGNIILDTEKTETYDIYDTNYKAIPKDAMPSGGIVWIAKSADNKYASVILSAETAAGTVTELWTEDGRKKVKINSVVYGVSPKCSFGEKISVGLKADFYLDPAGNIAGYRASASADMHLGYLYNAKVSGSFNDTVSMAIFDGEHKTVKCAERVTINGEKAANNDDIILSVTASDGGVEPQLIRFRTDSDGRLTEFETAVKLEEGQEETDRLFIEGETPSRDSGQKPLYYQPGYHYVVGNYFAFEATSKIFIIPSDITEKDDFRLTTPQYIGEQNMYGLKAYKTDSSYDFAVAGVWRDTLATVDISQVASDAPCVVLDISETYYNEEEAYTIKTALGATVKEVPVTDEKLVEILKSGDIKKGDIIRYDLDSGGSMATLAKDYDYESNSVVNAAADSGFTAKYRLISSKVTKKMNSSIKVKTTSAVMVPYVDEELIVFGAYGATRTALVNIVRGNISVRSASIADVNVGDRFVYMSRNGFILYMYIIKD